MKQQISKDYQTELKLEGDCEVSVGKADEKAKEEKYSPSGLTTVPGAEKGTDLKKEAETEEKAAI